MKTFDARTRERWRGWLAKHHASESEVWLIFHKRHTGKPTVAYDDAVDEALCYGWIDSLIKRIDDDRYARKFTPRKAESNWSSANIKRYKALKKPIAGHAGAAAEPARTASRRYAAPRPRCRRISRTPSSKNAQAWKFFEGLAPSYRRLYVSGLMMPSATRRNNAGCGRSIEMLKIGRKPGL